MTVIGDGEGRVRAWILVQADSPSDAAYKLYDALGNEGGNDFVVIRADVVDYVYNIMIPVDAASGEWLRHVHLKILDITGARHSVVIPVVQLVPFIPHDANGFITEAEARAGHEEVPKPGRQGWSPGMNAWG
jgi:hypothetical protein